VEASISNGMCSEAPWALERNDIDKVGFEVEHIIFDYLLEEFTLNLLS